MHLFGIILILFMGSISIGALIYSAFQARAYSGLKKWTKIIGFSLMALGAFGFFGIALSATGGLCWLPFSFEWPVGSARGALVMPNHEYVVPVNAPSRIQIYDSNWKFLRGWYVDTYDGPFQISVANPNKIEVITAKRELRYVCSLEGSILSQGTYAPKSYADFPASGQTMAIPTRWWLWMFEGPFYCGIVVILGMAILFVTEPKTKFELSGPPGI
jgi:hypothetical protein